MLVAEVASKVSWAGWQKPELSLKKKSQFFSPVLLKTVAQISHLRVFLHNPFNICDHWAVFLAASRISKSPCVWWSHFRMRRNTQNGTNKVKCDPDWQVNVAITGLQLKPLLRLFWNKISLPDESFSLNCVVRNFKQDVLHLLWKESFEVKHKTNHIFHKICTRTTVLDDSANPRLCSMTQHFVCPMLTF